VDESRAHFFLTTLFIEIKFNFWTGAPALAGAKTPVQSAKMKLISGSHRIGQSVYHFEWCPKYRYKMFKREENKKLCENILDEIAQRHGIILIELAVMPDHIHLIVDLPPTISISYAFHLLKGASSHGLFKRNGHKLCEKTYGKSNHIDCISPALSLMRSPAIHGGEYVTIRRYCFLRKIFLSLSNSINWLSIFVPSN